jgi:hypothetical protein
MRAARHRVAQRGKLAEFRLANARERDRRVDVAPQRVHFPRAQPMLPAAVPRPARRPTLAAMHAAHSLAAHRRLPAGAMVVLAPRLAAGHG